MDSEKQTAGVLPADEALQPMPPATRPRVPMSGDIVHIVASTGLKHWPAIVVDVRQPNSPASALDLKVFAGNSDYYAYNIPFHADGLFTKSWHWIGEGIVCKREIQK